MTSWRTLARHARARDRARELELDRCELCGARLAGRHSHVMDIERQTPRCACRACGLLFEKSGASQGRYRKAPDRVLRDEDVDLTDRAWTALGVPVGVALFQYRSRLEQWIALFPSPAGMTEAELDGAAWRHVADQSRLAAIAAPDVEALLAYRPRSGGTGRCYLVPIDLCYRLVARVRTQWRGIGGGGIEREVDAFVAEIHEQSRPVPPQGGEV